MTVQLHNIRITDARFEKDLINDDTVLTIRVILPGWADEKNKEGIGALLNGDTPGWELDMALEMSSDRELSNVRKAARAATAELDSPSPHPEAGSW